MKQALITQIMTAIKKDARCPRKCGVIAAK